MRRLIILSLALASACSGDARPLPTPPADTLAQVGPAGGPAITRLVISPASASIPRGSAFPFTLDAYDANGVHVPTPPGVVWTVENADVGRFDAAGPGGFFRAATEWRARSRHLRLGDRDRGRLDSVTGYRLKHREGGVLAHALELVDGPPTFHVLGVPVVRSYRLGVSHDDGATLIGVPAKPVRFGSAVEAMIFLADFLPAELHEWTWEPIA